MDPEKQIPQDDEQQGGDTSSNTYPGQWPRDKAQKLYNLSQAPNKIKNFKKGMKNAGKMGKAKGAIQAANTAGNAGDTTKSGFQSVNAIFEILSPLPLPPYSSEPFSTKTFSSTPKFVSKIITSLIGKLGGTTLIVIIAIIVIIIVLITTLSGDSSSTSSNQQLAVSGPVFAKIGDKLDYTIAVDYQSAAKDIIVTDQIPQGTEYVNAPQATFDPATNTVTWNIPATTSTTLSLTLLATKDNNYIVNILKGTIPNKVLGESDSLPASKTNPLLTPQLSPMAYPLTPKFNIPNTTPTIFQLAPTSIPISPSDTNIIKSCVVTKVGEPVIIPSLPPECTNF